MLDSGPPRPAATPPSPSTSTPTPLRRAQRVLGIGALSLLVVWTVSACDGGHNTPTSPATPQTYLDLQTLTSEVRAATDDAINNEYRAEAIYDRVLIDFGAETRPFANIVNAEERHSESLARLYEVRGLAVPPSAWNVDNVPTFDSVLEACRAGAGAERANIALYDRYLRLELPPDVHNVFTNNRAASLLNHLPAFEACIALGGG